MPGRRWLLICCLGQCACLLAGCLRDRAPAEEASLSRPTPAAPPSNYLISRPPPISPKIQTEVEPIQKVALPIPPENKQPPARPADPPVARMELHPPPPLKPEPPLVQTVRGLLNHHSLEEVREQLKSYDSGTRDALLILLGSAVQLEQAGGIGRIGPRDLTSVVDRLHDMTSALQPLAQLKLDKMCFCSHIEDFGKFKPLHDASFMPGQYARVYVQVRNFASRRNGELYETVLKGKLEIYDETNRRKPAFFRDCEPCHDFSRAPRQDYFVFFRFQVPPNCPPGSYTLWITVEDWTDAPAGAKHVASPRVDRCSLDFRVGGFVPRPSAPPVAAGTPAR